MAQQAEVTSTYTANLSSQCSVVTQGYMPLKFRLNNKINNSIFLLICCGDDYSFAWTWLVVACC